jgi:hypothetical protein
MDHYKQGDQIGQILSIGLLFPFWHFLKIAKVAHYFGLRFSAVQVNFYKAFVGLFYWRLL